MAGADHSRETINFSGERPMALEVQALTGRRFAAPIDFAAHIQRAARDLVRVAVGLGRNPIPEDLWPILATHASETLPPGTENALEAARPVTVIELEVAAGEGTPELREELKGRDWFWRGWLEQRGLNAEDCIVIGCKGQSMEPTLPDGCSILVDRSSVEWEPSRIMLLRTGEGLVVKHAADEVGARIMQSDNPDWPDAPLPEDAEIIGRVRWVGCGIDGGPPQEALALAAGALTSGKSEPGSCTPMDTVISANRCIRDTVSNRTVAMSSVDSCSLRETVSPSLFLTK